MVTGLAPNSTLHETNVYVEPISGIMMGSEKRIQISLQVNSTLMYPNLSAAYIPVMWVEEVKEIFSM